MKPDPNEPLPLHDPRSSETPPLLRHALGAARDKLPTAEDLAAIAAGLPLGGPGGQGGQGGQGAPRPPTSVRPPASTPASATALPSTLPGVLLGAALGALVSALSLLVLPLDGPATPPNTAETTTTPAVEPPETLPLTPASASPAAPPTPPAAPLSAAPLPGDHVPATPATSTDKHASPGATATAASLDAAAPSTSPPSVPGAATDPTPESEVDLLKRARSALGPAPATALTLTAEHAARFPRGALGQEREVLAIQALVQLGRRDEARARAARFLAAFPGSAHRVRLEALVGPDPR